MVKKPFVLGPDLICSYTGVCVKPAKLAKKGEDFVYIHIRIDDEVSSHLCREIERMSNNGNGIVVVDGFEQAAKSLESTSLKTGLFHSNCRCRLVIKPNSIDGNLDYLNTLMAVTDNSLTYNQSFRTQKHTLRKSEKGSPDSPYHERRKRSEVKRRDDLLISAASEVTVRVYRNFLATLTR